jgi:hypothetical protein
VHEVAAGYAAAVPLVPIRIVVTRPGKRADELLAAVARGLARDAITPDDNGVAHIVFHDAPSSGAAWDEVHAALEAVGDDWSDYVHLGPRRAR